MTKQHQTPSKAPLSTYVISRDLQMPASSVTALIRDALAASGYERVHSASLKARHLHAVPSPERTSA